MIQRMIGAAFFRAQTYEEIEADQGALGQAVAVVLLVTLCGIVGGVVGGLLGDASALRVILGAVGGLVFGIIRWALWVTVMYLVGGKMLRTSNTETSWSELGRVMGFAYTPGVLSVLSFIPAIGNLFPVIGFCWTVAAMTVAVRQALDFESTGRAIGVVLLSAVIGFIPWIIVIIIQAIVLGPPAAPEVQSAVKSLFAMI